MDSNVFNAWYIYETVVKNNYMYHEEIISNISQEIKTYKEFSVLDIGCGDSYVVANSVPTEKLRNYFGIDSSHSAIEYARNNLCNHGSNVNFIFGDMVECIHEVTEKFNLIVAGYSLHHLQHPDKEKTINKISNILDDRGLFVFYDVMSRPEENEIEYNERACRTFISKWDILQPSERKQIENHVMENDHPESEESYTGMLFNAGFDNITVRFRDQDELFCLFMARKG